MKDKILVVEDNATNAAAAAMALEEMNIEVSIAASAEEAIEMLNEKNFLAVLTDMHMPAVKSGHVDPKAGEIVAEQCGKKMIPCFVITAGILHYGGIHKVVDVIFGYHHYVGSEHPTLWHEQLRDRQKNFQTYKEVWEIITKNFDQLLRSRRRYIKYVLSDD